jgi:hypothetical protein
MTLEGRREASAGALTLTRSVTRRAEDNASSARPAAPAAVFLCRSLTRTLPTLASSRVASSSARSCSRRGSGRGCRRTCVSSRPSAPRQFSTWIRMLQPCRRIQLQPWAAACLPTQLPPRTSLCGRSLPEQFDCLMWLKVESSYRQERMDKAVAGA